MEKAKWGRIMKNKVNHQASAHIIRFLTLNANSSYFTLNKITKS